MKPARFSYEAPTTLAEVLASLAARGDGAKIIAGGQSLAPMMNMRLAQPGHLIDINRIPELAGVRVDGDRLMVGAMTRHADLVLDPLVRAHAPMLGHAAGTIGHYAIRQRGTLGGSLAHADPAAQLPLVAVALEAEVELASATERRSVAAADFFQSIFTTALTPEEILVAMWLPLRAKQGWGFRLFSRRAGDFALVAVAVTMQMSQRTVSTLRVAAGGIAATPLVLEAPPAVRDIDPRDPQWAKQAAATFADAAEIESDERVPTEYRRDLLAVLLEGALVDALERTA